MTQIFIRYIHLFLAMLVLFIALGLAVNAHAAESNITIASSGQVIVRGAKVVAVSGSAITARTTWGASSLTWSVRTSGSTKFYPAGSTSTETLHAIKIGDEVSFSGALDTNAPGLAVRATVFKDESLVGTVQSIPGTVTEVNADGSTLTVTTEDGPIKVIITRGTILTLDGDTVDIEDVRVGDKLQVSGSRNMVSNVLTADRLALYTPDDAIVAVESGGFFSNIYSWLMGTRGALSTR